MKKGEFRELLAELCGHLKGMDLPPGKNRPTQNDGLRWLARNLAQRNRTHASYGHACAILAKLGHPVADARD